MRVQTSKLKSDAKNAEVVAALAKAYGVSQDKVSSTFIGPSWGADISKKALQGLIAFLILVSLVIAFYFRTWTMALAGIVALLHDLLITAGVYALVGFEVSPASVIGFLTILGYSLYDTVVVFDKVRENTQNLTATAKSTYSEAANLAVNQTLVRSINTSVVALLPIASILVIGTILVGAGTLEDLALALFVGIATGTYSSIFIATPLLADLRERQPEMKALAAACSSAGRRRRGRRPPVVRSPRTRSAARSPTRVPSPTALAPRPPRQPARRPAAAGAHGTSPSGPRRSPAASAGEPARRRAGGDRRAADEGGSRLPRAGDPVSRHHAVARRRPGVPGPHRGLGRAARRHRRGRRRGGPGFILAAPLAARLGVGFVPIRKAGSHRAERERAAYALEYGEAVLEVTHDAVRPGQRVLLVDDVLATGGTAAAAAELVERPGAQVVAIQVLIELTALRGRRAAQRSRGAGHRRRVRTAPPARLDW